MGFSEVEYSPDRIYLIGMMGVGKSTIGKKLARALHSSFIDLDKEIEYAEGMSIPELFELKGESYFRKKEQECLYKTHLRSHVVIATGGGTPAFVDNMDWMNAHGKTVYLRAEAAFIMSRVGQFPGKRPLLKDKDGEELTRFISELLESRKPVYERASIVVEMPLKDVSELVKSVV